MANPVAARCVFPRFSACNHLFVSLLKAKSSPCRLPLIEARCYSSTALPGQRQPSATTGCSARWHLPRKIRRCACIIAQFASCSYNKTAIQCSVSRGYPCRVQRSSCGIRNFPVVRSLSLRRIIIVCESNCCPVLLHQVMHRPSAFCFMNYF
jgi:hypothetical protein